MQINKIKKTQLEREIKNNPKLYLTLSDEYKKIEDFASSAIIAMPSLTAYLPDEFNKNKVFFKKVLKEMPVVFKYMIDFLKEDKELLDIYLTYRYKMTSVSVKKLLKEDISEEEMEIKNVLSKRIKNDVELLLFVFKKIRDVVSAEKLFLGINEKFKEDKFFITKLIGIEPYMYNLIRPIFQEDIDVMKSVMKKDNGKYFYLFDLELTNDPLFVLSMSEYGEINKGLIGEELRKEIGDHDLIPYLKSKLLNEKLVNDLKNESIIKPKLKI